MRLGAFKHELSFKKAKFIRQKAYLEEYYEGVKFKGKNIKDKKYIKQKDKRTIKSFCKFRKIKITCAGMPSTCYGFVTWDNFKTGFTCSGKLTFKHLKGGVKLVGTDFTIKEEKIKTSIAKMKK